MVFRLALLVTLYVSSKCVLVGEQPIAPAEQLIGAMNRAAGNESLGDKFDLVIRTNSTKEFGDEFTWSELTIRRLQVDDKNKFARQAMQKYETDSVTGKLSLGLFASAVIDGPVLTLRGKSGKREVKYRSYEEAKAAAMLNLPKYFGIIRYPYDGDREEEIKRVQSIILHPDTTVQKAEAADQVTFKARYEPSKGKFDVHTWKFRLPHYAPTQFTLDRSIKNNDLRRYWTQEVFWKDRDGRPVVRRLTSETVTVRREDGGFEIGKKLHETDFYWLPVADELDRTRSISRAEAVLQFLDDGAKHIKEIEKAND